MIREGILARPFGDPEIGYARLATTLRSIPIAFQSDRYLIKIDEAIQSAKMRRAEYDAQGDREPSSVADGKSESKDFGLTALETIGAMFKPLIELAPRSQRAAIDNLKNARTFLQKCARAENKIDRYAREQLVDELDGMILMLETTHGMQFDVLQWLEELPRHCSILSSGPSPGCIHVSSLELGGYSGRSHLYVIGLDDSRFPRRSPVDPVLLDSERIQLSHHLPTSIQQSREHQQLLYRVLHRVLDAPDLHVTLSHSVRQFSNDRECFPSPSMLDIYRTSSGSLDASMDDLKKRTGRPISFVSESLEDHLISRDSVLAEVLHEQDVAARQQMLESRYEHIQRSRIAFEHAASPEFTAFDGYVPKAGRDLDPSAGLPVSSSRLETYGTCPRRFFFQRGLNVYPPTQWSVDPERWLDPLLFGNLVHSLFEEFLKGLTSKSLTPNLSRDRAVMIDLLHAKIQSLAADVPSPNADAFLRQRKQLEDMCEVFLMNEEKYCRDNQATPWILESSIGLAESPRNILDSKTPVSISLSDGRVLNVNGRIDRVDKQIVEGSQRYVIWDYKSGSNHGFDQANPFNQGRKLQPFLYLGLLRHRIAAIGGDTDSVASFGYFFPNPKLDGLRLQWTRAELRDGDLILRNICDSITNGVFLATTNKSDCTYCDYQSVCGEPSEVASKSMLKLQAADTPMLTPLRRLRETDITGSAQHD